MVAGFTKALKRVLRDGDCCMVRQGKGDHEIWYSPITDKHFPVDNKILSRHLANGVLKQAGLDHRF